MRHQSLLYGGLTDLAFQALLTGIINVRILIELIKFGDFKIGRFPQIYSKGPHYFTCNHDISESRSPLMTFLDSLESYGSVLPESMSIYKIGMTAFEHEDVVCPSLGEIYK